MRLELLKVAQNCVVFFVHFPYLVSYFLGWWIGGHGSQ